MKLHLPTWADQGVGLALALLYGALLVATLPSTGIPRDESFYLDAADNAGRWVLGLFDPKVESLSDKEIRRGFEYNHEHPVLMKTLFGVSHELLKEKWDLVEHHLTAYRMPTVVLAALSIWLAFLLGVMVEGRAAGLVGALALAFMPRPFLHVHLSCFDGPVTFMWLLVAYTYLRAARSRAWAPAAGVAVGLGLATKLNIFFVPFALLGVAAMDLWRWRRQRGRWTAPKGERGPLTYFAWIAVCMVVLGLGVFWAHWPWLYHETLPRLREYVSFHAKHVDYPVEYLGTLYFKPPFPVHFPFVYSALTLPVGILVLFAIGLAVVLRRAWPEAGLLGGFALWLMATLSLAGQGAVGIGGAVVLTGGAGWLGWRALRRMPPIPAWAPDRRVAELFLLVNLAVPFVIIAAPSTPIFGGIKHWMPAMPFLAVVAGVGAARMGQGLLRAAAPMRQAFAGAIVGACMLVPAGWATLIYHPHGEVYFNELAGGPPGGAALGMPRNFWGYSTIAVLDTINERVERRGRVFWHKLTHGAYRDYQRDGLLRRDVSYTGDWTAPYSDWAVHHDQKEKLPEELDIWRSYGVEFPVDGYFVDGVQIMAVYHRPGRPQSPAKPPGAR